MSMYRLCSLFALYNNILLLAGIGSVVAITWANEVNVSICNWSQLRANIVRDTIYLDGGNLWWQFGLSDGNYGTPFDDTESGGYMYNISLAQSFDQQTNMTGLIYSMAKNGGSSAANVNPNYVDGAMLANNYEFILYGGLDLLTDSTNPPPSEVVLGYEAYQDSTNPSQLKPGFMQKSTNNGVTRYVTNGAGVSAPSENLGFYFSGMQGANGGIIEGGDGSANTTATSLITVNMTTVATENWQNTSLPSYVLGRANAEVVWLPVSESGVLVVIGGVINPEILTPDRNLTVSEAQASSETSPTFMQELSIYDIASQTWYLQNTTGNIPPPLTLFCSAVAPASDSSSFNIYIYGGYDGVDAGSTPSDDVYILSVPSFIWIKAYSGQAAHGRSGHKCLKVYPDKMFVLGGVFQDDPAICLDGGFIQVFNLNTLQFQDTYNPANWSNYTVPSIVTGQIGGDMNGGATKTSPSSWNNGSLGDIFAKPYTKPITTYYPYESATQTSVVPTTSATATATGTGSQTSGTMRPRVKIALSLSVCLGGAFSALVGWLFARKLARHKLLKAVRKPNINQNDDRTDASRPSSNVESLYKAYSTSTGSRTNEGFSRPQSQGAEHLITPVNDGTIHTQADGYPIFELDSRVDKRVELSSEECVVRKNMATMGRNLRDLRIYPHVIPETSSESIQNTPTEYQGKLPCDNVPAKLSRLASVYFPRDRRESSSSGSPLPEDSRSWNDKTMSNMEWTRSFPVLKSHFSANSEGSDNRE